MYHYVYKLEHIETSEFYIGSRSCKCHPTLDNYKGSMLTWKPDKNMLKKTIIRDDFKNRDDAMEFEAETIIDNIKNPLNRNFSIPGKKFHCVGMLTVKDPEGKTFLTSIYDERILKGDLKPVRLGEIHTEEAKKKMSESAKNRKITEEMEKLRKEKISKTMKGVSKSKDFCENMSLTRKGENNPYSKYLKDNNIEHHSKGKKYEKSLCPHCKRMISKSVIHIAHMDNCKMKNNDKKDKEKTSNRS